MRVLASVFIAAYALAGAGELLPKSEFEDEWRTAKEFTLAVANAMPADGYQFRPVPAEMTFGELMIHIAEANVYRLHQITGRKPPARFGESRNETSRASALATLAESFDYVLEALSGITDEQLLRSFTVRWEGRPRANGRQIILNMFVHTAHHRAQAEVYLRLQGLVPPVYKF